MIGFAVWLAIVAYVFAGPLVFSGRRAFNSGAGITLPPASISEADGQSPAGIRAQETAEFRLAWFCGLIVALPFIWLPLSWAAVPIAAAAGQTLARAIFDGFDYVGHGVEIMVAEEEGRIGYRDAEIQRMIDRDRSRTGMSPVDVDRKLKRWHWLARIMRRLV